MHEWWDRGTSAGSNAPGSHPRLDPHLRSSLAARRSDRRRRRRRPDRPEEPRLRRHRGHPVAERAVRRGRRRDPVRGLRHQPTDLDRAELGPGGGGRERGAGGGDHRTSRTSRRSSPGSRWPRVCCSCSSPCSRWDGSRSSCRGPSSPGFLFGAAIDVVIGELPKLTGTDATGSNSFQELWSWLGTLGDAHRPTVLVGVVSLVVVFGLRRIAPARPRRARAGRRWTAGLVAVRPRSARRRARRRRAARAAVVRGPRRAAAVGPRRHGRASRRWRWS